MSAEFAYSRAPLRRKELQFSVFSPEDIRAQSVTQEAFINGKRIKEGINTSDVTIEWYANIRWFK